MLNHEQPLAQQHYRTRQRLSAGADRCDGQLWHGLSTRRYDTEAELRAAGERLGLLRESTRCDAVKQAAGRRVTCHAADRTHSPELAMMAFMYAV